MLLWFITRFRSRGRIGPFLMLWMAISKLVAKYCKRTRIYCCVCLHNSNAFQEPDRNRTAIKFATYGPKEPTLTRYNSREKLVRFDEVPPSLRAQRALIDIKLGRKQFAVGGQDRSVQPMVLKVPPSTFLLADVI
jgi:hypothetical protein